MVSNLCQRYASLLEGDRMRDQPGNSDSMWCQFSTFYISDRLYGIEVTRVQEIVKPMEMTEVPLAPDHIRGLINLRGQVATAIGVRQLFGADQNEDADLMNVVCNMDNHLISLQVDKIGDVVEVEKSSYEPTPQTVPERTRRFLDGVYKDDNKLLSIINIDKVAKFLNQAA